MNYSFLEYIVLIVAILIIGYIAVRIWAYGVFRSFFEAKKHNSNSKEGTKNGSSR